MCAGCSSDLRPPEAGVIGREEAVLRAEISLQLDAIALLQHRHALQPERGGLGDMRTADLAEGSPDLNAAVQDQPTVLSRLARKTRKNWLTLSACAWITLLT